jgi:hypothetical protein
VAECTPQGTGLSPAPHDRRSVLRGELAVVATPDRIPLWVWIYQKGYQTAGYFKAAVLQGC